MAFSITSNYNGEAASGYISAALYAASSLDKGFVNVYSNVKDTVNVTKMDFNNLIQADGASWNSSGTLTVTENTITPTALKVNFAGDIYNWESHWVAASMRPGAQNSEYTNDLASYINAQLGAKVGEQLEYNIWCGNLPASLSANTSHTGYTLFDGIVKAIMAGSPQTVTLTATTAANILHNLKAVYNAIPATIRMASDMRIIMNEYNAGLYRLACADVATGSGAYYVGDRALDFMGIKIEVTHGLPNGIILAAQISNLHVATDLLSDKNEVKILDQRETSGEDTFRYKMRMKFGTNVGYAAECVIAK